MRNDSRLPDPELAHTYTYAHNARVLGQVRYVRLLVGVLENKTGGRDETYLPPRTIRLESGARMTDCGYLESPRRRLLVVRGTLFNDIRPEPPPQVCFNSTRRLFAPENGNLSTDNTDLRVYLWKKKIISKILITTSNNEI